VVAWLSDSYSTSGLVSTWMGDRLRAGKPSQYVGPSRSTEPLWEGKIHISFRADTRR